MRHRVEQLLEVNRKSLKVGGSFHEAVLQLQVGRQFPGVVQLRGIRQRHEFLLQIGFTAQHGRQNETLDFSYWSGFGGCPLSSEKSALAS
jgi:hypothetical protein